MIIYTLFFLFLFIDDCVVYIDNFHRDTPFFLRWFQYYGQEDIISRGCSSFVGSESYFEFETGKVCLEKYSN